MKRNGTVIHWNNIIFLTGAAIITFVVFYFVYTHLCFLEWKKSYQGKYTNRITNIVELKVQKDVTASPYNPTELQCDSTPDRTADGSKIDLENPQRWIGLSRDILFMVPYGDSVYVTCQKCPLINGWWINHDTGPIRALEENWARMDILISNTNEVTFGGCWKAHLNFTAKCTPLQLLFTKINFKFAKTSWKKKKSQPEKPETKNKGSKRKIQRKFHAKALTGRLTNKEKK